MQRKYSSTRSNAARKIVAASLPAPCYRCGRVVTAEMKWEADHPVSRVQAEAMGISQAEQDSSVVAAHASCNHSHGASLGNKLKAAPRTELKITPIKRKIEFLEEGNQSPEGALQFLPPEASE